MRLNATIREPGRSRVGVRVIDMSTHGCRIESTSGTSPDTWVLLSIAGRQFGFFVPGTDAYAGYLMAGSSFLALAHTLRRNEHIRVTLLLNLSPPRVRRALDLWSHAIAVLLSFTLTQATFTDDPVRATIIFLVRATLAASLALSQLFHLRFVIKTLQDEGQL